MAELNQEKQGSRKILLTIFIIVLIAVNGVLLYLNIKNKDEITQIKQEKEVVDLEKQQALTKLDSISKQLDIRIAEVQKLGGDIESLQSIKEELEKDKKDLQQMAKNAKFAAGRYEEKIRTYETMLNDKDKEIEKLKGVNDELFSENKNLKTQKNSLSDSIRGLDNVKKQLSEKVAIASVLKAENLSINVISEKGKERDGGEYKAKHIDKIKIAFSLAENNVAKIESKDIYMRLIEPDGSTLFDLSTGGGTFSHNGKESSYTAKQSILFDNTRQTVAFVYSKGTPYKQGRHTIELFADNYKIGQGAFVVK